MKVTVNLCFTFGCFMIHSVSFPFYTITFILKRTYFLPQKTQMKDLMDKHPIICTNCVKILHKI